MEDKISYPSENMKELDLEALTSPGAQKVNNIRIVCISDTHSTVMDPLSIPDGDILIHAGDFTNFGEVRYINLFNEFLGCLPHRNKIVIAGNHDILFDPGDFKLKNVYWDLLRPDLHSSEYVKGLLTNCMMLGDGEWVKDIGLIAGRDKNRLIIIDGQVHKWPFHTMQVVPILPFFGDPADILLSNLSLYLFGGGGLGDSDPWEGHIPDVHKLKSLLPS